MGWTPDKPVRKWRLDGRGLFAALLALSLWACAPQAHAQELFPDEGPFASETWPDPYRATLRETLVKEHAYRLCQVVAVPAFDPEWAVYLIKRDGGSHEVVLKMFQKQLRGEVMSDLRRNAQGGWYSIAPRAQEEVLARIPKPVDRLTAPLSSETAGLLEQAWGKVLSRVRYPEKETEVVDGTTYYVGQWQKGSGFRSGRTVSPELSTTAGRLIDLATALQAYVQASPAERKAREAALALKATSLLKYLSNSDSPRTALNQR